MSHYDQVPAAKALEIVEPGDNVYIQAAAGAPQVLIDALVERAPQLKDVSIYHLHTEATAQYVNPEYKGIFEVYSLFIGSNVRKAIWEGRANFIPCFLSEVPVLFRKGTIPLDVALIQVSPPDRHGFCSLGASVEATRAAMQMAKHVIAQVNEHMPRTHGDGIIHISEIDALVEGNLRLPETILPPPNEVENQIGNHIAGMIEDGSTLQMGIGNIPDSVLSKLTNHKDLGVHTEMFSDGVIPLVEKGIINNKRKKIHPGKIISGFVIGSQKLYDFIDDNPLVNMLDIEYVNDVRVIRKTQKLFQ